MRRRITIWRDACLRRTDGVARELERFWARQGERVSGHVMKAVLALSTSCGGAHHRCLWESEEQHLIASDEE